MINKTTLVFILLSLFFLKANACINYYVIDSSGHRNLHNDYPPSSIYVDPKSNIKKLKYLEEKINTSPQADKYKYISNYCAQLIKLGRHKDAIPVLENLLKDKPAEYTIIANLAVAYELDGQIEKAYSALKKSLELVPNSHQESEWFHLRVLEASIEINKKHINPQDINILKIDNDTSKIIGKHISYQLKERIPLTKSNNEILSKVIEESADFYKANISLEWAIELYAIAISYTASDNIKLSLWQKINATRQKLIEFGKQGNRGSDSKYLFDKNWEKNINKIIKKWENYKPYYYDKKILTTF